MRYRVGKGVGLVNGVGCIYLWGFKWLVYGCFMVVLCVFIDYDFGIFGFSVLMLIYDGMELN